MHKCKYKTVAVVSTRFKFKKTNKTLVFRNTIYLKRGKPIVEYMVFLPNGKTEERVSELGRENSDEIELATYPVPEFNI